MFARNTYTPSENAAVANNPVLDESTPLISTVLRDGHIALQESWNEKAARMTRDIVKRNTGLLLITVSQLFFSLLNVAVKKSKSLDPPISTMQVCYINPVDYLCSSSSFSVNKLIAIRMVCFIFSLLIVNLHVYWRLLRFFVLCYTCNSSSSLLPFLPFMRRVLGLLLVCVTQSSDRGESDCFYCWEAS